MDVGKVQLRPAIHLVEWIGIGKRCVFDEGPEPVQWMDAGNERSQEHCGYLLACRTLISA